MKSFWKIFLYAMPLGFGVVMSLISIAYTVKVVSNRSPDDEIIAAIFFGIIGFPMIVASAIRFTQNK